MGKLTLYILVGYPGSGKTTTSRIIAELTGAVHIWADHERRAMFAHPTHSKAESDELYSHLNKTTEILMSDKTSVIFDTNFNYKKDRDLLRSIAAKHKADVNILWIKADRPVARERATAYAHAAANKYLESMTKVVFDKLAAKLEAPSKDEQPIILDGTKIEPKYVARKLGL